MPILRSARAVDHRVLRVIGDRPEYVGGQQNQSFRRHLAPQRGVAHRNPEAELIRELLGRLGLPISAPTLAPARGPPLLDLPVPGLTEREADPKAQPAPDFAAKQILWRDEFDQRVDW